ncbi:hypothetical protein ACTHQ4_20830 [Alkalicoccobacillus gibsonii]|uniref:hypothetical protein n=1 Tax=Alkalicoccobacillus gibsonii TaxID=79881 RepID=UPI003F7B9156
MSLFLFSAIFINALSLVIIARQKNKGFSIYGVIGVGTFIIMSGLTINFFVSENPILLNFSALLWFLIIVGFLFEVIGLVKKSIPIQLLGASLHLFIVFPTIFSIGIILLIVAIAELLGALFFFFNNRRSPLPNAH